MSMYIPFRVSDEFGRRLVALAAVETGTNTSMLVRRLLEEAWSARYGTLTPGEAVAEAVASVRAEGLEPSAKVLDEIAAGEVAVEEAVEQLADHHSAEVPPPAFREPAAPKPVRTSGKALSKVEQQKAMREARYGG